VKTGPHAKPAARLCANCGKPFVVDPRVGKRHRFCSLPACVKVSRREAQKKWRNAGGKAYLTSEENVRQVREWRKLHPLYWKRTRQQKGRRPAPLRISRRLATVLRSVALEDVIDSRLALEIGMISRLSGAALQDAIAAELRATMLRGYAILRGQRITPTR